MRTNFRWQFRLRALFSLVLICAIPAWKAQRWKFVVENETRACAWFRARPDNVSGDEVDFNRRQAIDGIVAPREPFLPLPFDRNDPTFFEAIFTDKPPRWFLKPSRSSCQILRLVLAAYLPWDCPTTLHGDFGQALEIRGIIGKKMTA